MNRWPFDPAAVAAGAIDDDQHADVAEAMRTDPEFAAAVADYQRLVDQLESLPAVVWDPVSPPQIDVTAITSDTPSAPSRRRRRVLVAVAAVVVLAVVGGVVARSANGRDRDERARAVQLLPLSDEPADVDARVSLPTGGGGTVHVHISGAEPTPAGFVEELWLMNSATDLVSLGTFRVAADGSADATFTTAADLTAFEYVDASHEPNDGNPAHSGASVLRSAPLR